MGSSFLSEVDDTSILRTGALHRYHYPLTWLSASRLLLPRSGLERSDFVLWHFSDVTAGLRNVCCWGKSGSRDCVTRLPSLTQSGHSAQRLQLCAMQTLKSPMCGPLVALLPSKRDPRKPANESGHSSYGAADINCDAVGIG